MTNRRCCLGSTPGHLSVRPSSSEPANRMAVAKSFSICFVSAKLPIRCKHGGCGLCVIAYVVSVLMCVCVFLYTCKAACVWV